MKRSRSVWIWLIAAIATGIAAISPRLDGLADRSFAWHMVQHLILLYVVSLLLVLSRPFDLISPFLSKELTAKIVHALRPLHAAASAPVALAFYVATLWLTHFSVLYEASLRNGALHVAEHALYLCAGVTLWLPVLAPAPLRPLPYPARLLYLLVALPQGALVSMAIFSARLPLYPHYVEAQGSVAAALQDQHAAAAVMWIAGGLVLFVALLAALGTWARRELTAECAVAVTRRCGVWSPGEFRRAWSSRTR